MFTIDEIVVCATGNGESGTARDYVNDIGAVSPSAHTWTCGANLAQWGAFRRDNGYESEDVTYILWSSNVGAFPVADYPDAWSRRYGQHFDF